MGSVASCLDLVFEVASTIKYNFNELYNEIVNLPLKNSSTKQVFEDNFNFVFHQLNKAIKRNFKSVNARLKREILQKFP